MYCMNVVNFVKLRENATIFTKGSEFAAGYDVYACIDECVEILPNSSMIIPTGIALEMPPTFFLGLYPRSGLACKQGLTLMNCVGIIDADYRGEIKVCLYNASNVIRRIYNGDRIAQAIFQRYSNVLFNQVTELSDTERSTGGFGSTGIK